jgi:hypothetical protein
MTDKIFLQLGDIIQLNAPTNSIYHNNNYFIQYLDSSRIILINEKSGQAETLLIDEDTKNLREESIEEISILNRDENNGYAMQNNLLPDTWIDISFGGDIPATITGRISNLEEDMIEITTYPDNDIIFIDFAYKGLPIDLPIEKITIREEPIKVKTNKLTQQQEETFENVDADFKEEKEEETISQSVIQQKINEILLDADQIQFGEDLGNVSETIRVSEKEKRYSIEDQTSDLLDELLSTIPNIDRTTNVLNNIHTMIERFVQLRDNFSFFDDNGNANMPIKKGHLYKPLAEAIYKLNFNLTWILPVVKNRKKVYNLDIDEDAVQGESMGNDIITKTLAQSLVGENTLTDSYRSKTINYSAYLNNLNEYLTPIALPSSANDIIIEKTIEKNLSTLVNNLGEFYSSVARGDELTRQKYVIQRYNLGLSSRLNKDNAKLDQITPNEKIPIESMVFLPRPIIQYSRINLPNTNMLMRANLNRFFPAMWNILKLDKVFPNKIISPDNDQVEFNLNKIDHFSLDESIILSPDERFKRFLNTIIPNTRTIFNAEKKSLDGRISLYNILLLLEPYLVYGNDLTYKQYEDMKEFTKDKIKNLKASYFELSGLFSKLQNFNVENYKTRCILYSILNNGEGLVSEIFKQYGFDSGCFLDTDPKLRISSSEVLNKMFQLDYGKTYMDGIAKINENLVLPFDYNLVFDRELKLNKQEIKKAKEKNDCKDYVLAKKYIDIDDLNADNEISIYFDKKFDPTFYDIIGEYNVQQEELNEPDFLEFLTNELIKNIGLNEQDAKFEAESMVNGSRLVKDGTYAVLEVMDDDALKNYYYIRENNEWIKDEKLTEENQYIDTDFFCNVQKKCLKIKDDCVDNKLGERLVREGLIDEMYNEFEDKVMKNRETIVKQINKNFDYDFDVLSTLININRYNFLKYNYEKISIEEELGDQKEEPSPYIKLREYILSQGDAIKRANDILLFSSKLTREALPLSEESPYWLYCKDTNTKLLPSFIPLLAENLILNNGENYLYTVESICKDRGTISDDGDKWVDKYSGYVIILRNLDNDEGYDSGFRVQSRDILEDELGSKLVQSSLGKNKQVEDSPLTKTIQNVITSLSRYLGIQLSNSMREFVILNAQVQMKGVKTEENYKAESEKYKATKKKEREPYEIYYNQTLLLITFAYLFISIQTEIPSVKTRKTHPGCVRSFSGAPLDGDDDISGITYLACVAHKIKSSIPPWNGIKKLSEKSIASKIKILIDFYVKQSTDIRSRLEEKKKYLLIDNDEEIPARLDIKNWINFLPPLVKLEIKTPQNITTAFKQKLAEYIKKGLKDQHESALVVQSKIMDFSIGIQYEIGKIVQKEQITLSSTKGPYLQNSCCYSKDLTPYQYMVSKDKSIEQYNNIVADLSLIIKDLRTLAQAPILFDPKNTKLVYPSIPNVFQESVIYACFIKFCNYLNDIPISDNMRRVCIRKPDYLNQSQHLEEQIRLLKKDDLNFDDKSLQELLNIVNEKNIVDIGFNTMSITPFENFQAIIQYIAQNEMEEDNAISQVLLSQLSNIKDKYVKDEEENIRDMRNYLSKSNDLMIDDIEKFIKKNSKLTRIKLKALVEEIKTMLVFKDTSNKEDDIMKMVLFGRNVIRNIGKVFPNMIINQVEYEDIKICKHWGFSEKHKLKLKVSLIEHYIGLKKFYGENTLFPLLETLQTKLTFLMEVEKAIPVILENKDRLTAFNKRTLQLLFQHFVLTIFDILTKLSSETDIIVRETIPNDETDQILNSLTVDEDATGVITEIEILEGEKKNIDEKVASLLHTFVMIIEKDKKAINYNEQIVFDKINRAKDIEKDDIVEELGDLSIEEREIQHLFKSLKIGRWGQGLQKGLTRYDPTFYDSEITDMERREAKRNNLRENGATDRNVDILEVENDMQERDSIDIENEEYSLANLPEDDDYGDNDDTYILDEED